MKKNQQNLRSLLALLFSTALLACAAPIQAQDATTAKGDFRIGERLPKGAETKTAAPSFKEITWDDLMPKDWDPAAIFKDLNLATLKDSDPRAMEALAAMQAAWNNAPVESGMNGRAVKIPGFLIPLERVRDEVREFLLVPYFGACIHTPPPPANQIIHVKVDPPLKKVKSMDPVWVSGVMETVRASTSMGTSGYRMKGSSVLPYEMPKP